MKRMVFTGMMALLLCAPAWAAAAPRPITSSTAGDDAKPWLGVMLADVTAEFAKKHDLAVTEGAYVSDVIDESPADSAGIKEGDVIIEFGGKKITDAQALVKAVAASSVGASVPVGLMRGKERKTLTVTLARAEKRVRVITRGIDLPDMPALPPPRTFSITRSASGGYGMKLSTLGEQLGKYFGAPNGKGVLVLEVKPDSKADKGGFTAGDVILKAGKKTITTVQDFTAAFGAYDDGEVIPVEVLRKGARQVLNLEVKAGTEGCDTLFDVGEGMFHLRGIPELDDEAMDIRIDTGEFDDAMKQYRIQVEKGARECDEAAKQMQMKQKQMQQQIRILRRVAETEDI